MRLVYLCSPYSSLDPAIQKQRFESACRCAAKLMAKGIHVFSPVVHNHPIAEYGELPRGWDFWKAYDEEILRACSAVYVLLIDGWKESVGVRAEIKIAEKLGLPVDFVNEDGEKTVTWMDGKWMKLYLEFSRLRLLRH